LANYSVMYLGPSIRAQSEFYASCSENCDLTIYLHWKPLFHHI